MNLSDHPSPHERYFINTRSARLQVVDRGGGPFTALFLHYWGGSSRTWAKVSDRLQSQARCVALDQRGWGASEATDDRFDLESMADDVEDLAAALRLETYVIVGHSMGGKVAQMVAARTPPGLAALVLVAPAPPHAMPVPAAQRDAMRLSYGSREGVEQAIQVLAGRRLDQTDHEAVVADTLAGAPGAKSAWTDEGMLTEVSANLPGFKGPVEIVVGELDQVERPEALRSAFAAALPQARLTVVPRAGHLLPLEDPLAIVEAVERVAAILGAG